MKDQNRRENDTLTKKLQIVGGLMIMSMAIFGPVTGYISSTVASAADLEVQEKRTDALEVEVDEIKATMKTNNIEQKKLVLQAQVAGYDDKLEEMQFKPNKTQHDIDRQGLWKGKKAKVQKRIDDL
jgi:hypothetical protein